MTDFILRKKVEIVGNLKGLSFSDNYVFQALKIDLRWAAKNL